jgi:hypothetical protein
MTAKTWREFRSSQGRDAVRFDLLERRFLRIRDRSRDDSRGRAYIVVDLWTLRVIPDQTSYRPKNGSGRREE